MKLSINLASHPLTKSTLWIPAQDNKQVVAQGKNVSQKMCKSEYLRKYVDCEQSLFFLQGLSFWKAD